MAMGASLGPGAMNPQELTLRMTPAAMITTITCETPHESPLSMTFPLMALAVPSVLIGLVGTPFSNYFEAFIHAPGEAIEALESGRSLRLD
jgi:NAD(P)H-quinone oxidoreductase subunit 5